MKTNTRVETIFKNNSATRRSDQSIVFLLLSSIFERSITSGRLRVIDVLGGIHDFGNGVGDRVAIRFHKSSAYWKLLLNPDLYLGEAYMNGDITITEGNVSDLLDVILKNVPAQGGFVTPTTMALHAVDFCMRHFPQINTPEKSRENVSHHYDLSSNLYKLFLDHEWQYSCAYFTSGKETLEKAQKNKMQLLVKKLLIKAEHHVLDIGCGWGGLARHIARETGAKVTGVTLSKEQLVYAEKRTRDEGLSELVKFKLCDYRHLEGVYDRIVSVGMFEHVGVDSYQTFFNTIRKRLKEDGVALLHSIGRSTVPMATNPWIKKYIFPGGYIPALSEVIPFVEKSGLILTDLEILRLHYAKTLKEWRKRFNEHRSSARSIYDERFCRMWEFYLASSEASFKYSGNMVFHMQLTKDQRAVPLTRDYLYEKYLPGTLKF
jgi:cyclopropane-fatty-acyl-phospholipid synthase